MGYGEGSREAKIDSGWNTEQLLGSASYFLSECAGGSRTEDPITNRDLRNVISDFGDHPGILAARDKGRRHRNLILIGDEEHIGKVHCRRLHSNTDVARSQRR